MVQLIFRRIASKNLENPFNVLHRIIEITRLRSWVLPMGVTRRKFAWKLPGYASARRNSPLSWFQLKKTSTLCLRWTIHRLQWKFIHIVSYNLIKHWRSVTPESWMFFSIYWQAKDESAAELQMAFKRMQVNCWISYNSSYGFSIVSFLFVDDFFSTRFGRCCRRNWWLVQCSLDLKSSSNVNYWHYSHKRVLWLKK